MNKFGFDIHHTDKHSNARTGIITTSHGKIRTPGFVAVGTAATVKTLTPEEIKECNIDVFFVNTYHMMFHPGMDTIKNSGGVHHFMNWNGSVMTDSGGFQAFSLSENGPRHKNELGGAKEGIPTARTLNAGQKGALTGRFTLSSTNGIMSDRTQFNEESLVKIKENGIEFTSAWDGRKIFLGPKESIQAQQVLGSDIMMAFDECTFFPITRSYAQEALARTHKWLDECVKQHKTNNHKINTSQALYGIVQGSIFEDLRIESARHVSSKDVEGFAIGSVANAKEPRKFVFDVLDWTMPILRPLQKPVHFLGIGEIEDIFESVTRGIDTLDCVTPTRMGRLGYIFSKEEGAINKFRYDISKSVFAKDQRPMTDDCTCYTCKNFTRSYLHHLFKSRELLGYRLATIHNLTFFGYMMEEIRRAITEDRFIQLKKEWIKR